ncbi:hypothetical protein ACFL6I_24125 [candidate division KSB1 bacterium]
MISTKKSFMFICTLILIILSASFVYAAECGRGQFKDPEGKCRTLSGKHCPGCTLGEEEGEYVLGSEQADIPDGFRGELIFPEGGGSFKYKGKIYKGKGSCGIDGIGRFQSVDCDFDGGEALFAGERIIVPEGESAKLFFTYDQNNLAIDCKACEYKGLIIGTKKRSGQVIVSGTRFDIVAELRDGTMTVSPSFTGTASTHKVCIKHKCEAYLPNGDRFVGKIRKEHDLKGGEIFLGAGTHVYTTYDEHIAYFPVDSRREALYVGRNLRGTCYTEMDCLRFTKYNTPPHKLDLWGQSIMIKVPSPPVVANVEFHPDPKARPCPDLGEYGVGFKACLGVIGQSATNQRRSASVYAGYNGEKVLNPGNWPIQGIDEMYAWDARSQGKKCLPLRMYKRKPKTLVASCGSKCIVRRKTSGATSFFSFIGSAWKWITGMAEEPLVNEFISADETTMGDYNVYGVIVPESDIQTENFTTKAIADAISSKIRPISGE